MACKGRNTLIVDPGESEAVLEFIADGPRRLRGILITHMHKDHIGGVAEIMRKYPHTLLYHPAAQQDAQCDIEVADGDDIRAIGFDLLALKVRATPGHCHGHVSYVGGGHIFCGDVLFSAGCGRLFDGDAADLAKSIAVFDALADDVRICCGHEYTLDNIAFAKEVEPDNAALLAWEQEATALRKDDRPTLPVTLGAERGYNPFLRAEEPAVVEAASSFAKTKLKTKTEVLGALRAWKDSF